MRSPIYLDPLGPDARAEREEGEGRHGLPFYAHPSVELLDHPRLWRWVQMMIDSIGDPGPAWQGEALGERSEVEVELLKAWKAAALRAELRLLDSRQRGNSRGRGPDPDRSGQEGPGEGHQGPSPRSENRDQAGGGRVAGRQGRG